MDQLKPNLPNATPLTPITFLERASLVYENCPSIIYNTTKYTLGGGTYRRCLSIASAIVSLGIVRGHVVSVVAPNVPAAYELHFAVPMSRTVLNNINIRLDPRTVSALLHHSESKLVFVYHQLTPLVLEALALLPDDHPRPQLVTHMCAAPIIVSMLTNLTPTPTRPDWPVHVLTGGSPPPTPILLRAESLGFVVGHGYGMTETGGVVISCAWKPDWTRLPATERSTLKARQGIRTLGMTQVDIINPINGLSVARDGQTVGEIVLRGGSIMLGYIKDPEGTNKCMGKDGWFGTGDSGVMHSDGYLEIKDRSKDIIISGGGNISSVEVESVLYSLPTVNEASVVAEPDEYWGETPCAFVSLSKGIKEKPSERDVIEYCRAKLPHYMVPKRVAFKELPKTSTGKIQKFVLRKMAKEFSMEVCNNQATLVSRL